MIDSMFQEGTDAALNDQVQRPRLAPPAAPAFSMFGLGLAAPQGVGAGVAKSLAFGSEMTGAFGQVLGATGADSSGGMFSTQNEQERKQAEAARQKLITNGGPDYSNEAGDLFRQRAKDILPDAQTTHASQQVVAGLFDFGTRAIGYGFTLGPLAPFVMGGDAALEESDRLKQLGVDKATRTKAGAVAGTIAGASLAVPLTATTRTAAAVKGIVAGEAGIVGQAAAEKAILAHAGYDKIANTFDPLDPVALAVGAVPGFFGAAMKPAPRTARVPHPGEAAGFSELQASADAARVDPDRLAVLKAEQAKPETTPAEHVRLQKEIDSLHATASEGVVRDAVQADPDMVNAARVTQVANTLEESRLTPDSDLAGREAHLSALEMAHDQMAAGEQVDVAGRLGNMDDARASAAIDSMLEPLRPAVPENDPHMAKLEPGARDTLADRYSRAQRDKPAFDSELQRIADDAGASVKAAPLKGTERAVGKVLGDYGGDATRIKDLLRATIQVDNLQQARAVIADLHDRFNVLEGSSRNLLDPNVQSLGGYRDAKFNVQLNGHVAEVQVNVPSMLKAKKEGHKLYVEAESLARAAEARGELGMPARVTELRGQMRELYDRAWTEATSARKADSVIAEPLRNAESTGKGRGEGGSQQMQSEGGTPAPTDTGIPSTSKNSAPSGNLAGKDGFMSTSGDSVTQSVAKAAEDVAKLDPDMLVHLEGMDAPMRVADLLARVKEEAKQDTLMGKLVEVAAACDLRA